MGCGGGGGGALLGAATGVGLAYATGGTSLLAGGAIGAGLAGQFGAGQDQANAIGAAGQAQLQQQQQDRAAAMQAAAPSAMEMSQLQNAITLNSQDISRRQKILASADPALIEAGHQALQLMQGKNAAAIAPLQNQRAQQRSQLEQTLAQHLGSDYATSSAGIQALNNFDQQTSNLVTNTQQQTLAQFLGVTQNAQGEASLQPGIQNAQNISATRGAINARQAKAITGNKIDQTLGYAGQIAQAGNNANAFGSLASLGMYGAQQGWGSGGGAENNSSINNVGSTGSGGGYGLGVDTNFGLNKK